MAPSSAVLVVNDLVVVPTYNVTGTVGGIRESYPNSAWVLLAFSHYVARSETPPPTRTPISPPATTPIQPQPMTISPWLLAFSAVVLALAVLGSFLVLRRAKLRS